MTEKKSETDEKLKSTKKPVSKACDGTFGQAAKTF